MKNPLSLLLPVAVVAVMLVPAGAAASLDLAVGDVGIGIGNSPRLIGLRLNGVDADVVRIDGVNLTLWNPRPSPVGEFNGLTVGLIGPKAGRLHGVAFGGIGATAVDRIGGLAVGGFGVGTERLRGLALGGVLTEIRTECDGIAASVLACRVTGRTAGAALGGIFAQSDTTTGLVAAGVLAVGKSLDGITIAPAATGFSGRLRGLGIGGFASGARSVEGAALSVGCAFAGEDATGLLLGGVSATAGKSLRGVALSLGGAGAGEQVDGIAIGGLGAGSKGRIRGLAAGSLVVMAPEVTGATIGALNGVIIESINLEDFLKIRTVNRRHTGLAIGLVNYTDELHGVQIGLLNFARNNPGWARLLPGINLHF